jgi:hypothetical protein
MSNSPELKEKTPGNASYEPAVYKSSYVQPGTSYSEMEIAAARMKSYTGAAVLVFILYMLFYIPGLIVNFIYYGEAQRMQRIAGHSLPGSGCLTFMLWINVATLSLSILGACGFMFLVMLGV